MVHFHPYWGKIPILNNIFQMGWNHQLEKDILFKSAFFGGYVSSHEGSPAEAMMVGQLFLGFDDFFQGQNCWKKLQGGETCLWIPQNADS